MKPVKCVVALALAVCAITSVSNAQTVAFLGGGSPSLFLELGQAAVVHQDSLTGLHTACIWTKNNNPGSAINATDNRTRSAKPVACGSFGVLVPMGAQILSTPPQSTCTRPWSLRWRSAATLKWTPATTNPAAFSNLAWGPKARAMTSWASGAHILNRGHTQ
jgi:hypothetical protein